MIYSFVVIIITPPAQAPSPVVQALAIVETLVKQPPEPGAINWHCPQCNWFNAYENMTLFKIGSKAHLRRCPRR